MQEKNPVLSFVVLLVIVGAAFGVLFLVFKPTAENTSDNTPKTTTTPSVTANLNEPTATVTPSVSVSKTVTPTSTPTSGGKTVASVTDAAIPDGWVAVVNDSQNYTAYKPKSYYFRMFSPDRFVLGIDTNKIPDASEYMGMISLMRLSASNNFDSALANLESGYTTYTRMIDNRTWTMVEGKTKANEIMSSKYVIYGKVSVGNKEYLAKLENGSANYGGFADEFEIFITTLEFR